VTALGIVLAHLVGDYLLQSHLTYTLPYVLVTQSVMALIVIAGTHMVIDRYRLARHIVWAKNLMAPKGFRAGHTPTGYPSDTPAWLAVWLLIIADNTLHLLINAAAVVNL
jgi:hypothetical protein